MKLINLIQFSNQRCCVCVSACVCVWMIQQFDAFEHIETKREQMRRNFHCVTKLYAHRTTHKHTASARYSMIRLLIASLAFYVQIEK